MHRTELGIVDYMRQLKAQLEAAPHGKRGALIRGACDLLQCSSAEIYRRLRMVGWESGRKPRADRGHSRLSDADAHIIGTLIRESTRANGKRLLSVENAYQIAVANGAIADSGLSPATIARQLKARGYHWDQVARPTPHQEMRSAHPNHTWQIDASVCVLFYLDRHGLAPMHEREFYRGKPRNFERIARSRVIRYLAVDHYSGAFYLEYFLGSEDSENLYRFFENAVSRRDHPQDPFHGVPLQLVLDAGAANTAHLFTNLAARLQMRCLTHLPGNPRAKGAVESTMNIVETQFEARLAFGARVRSLQELNERAHTWMRYYCGTREHSRHGATRYAMWQTIRESELRVAPPRELLRMLLHTRPQTCTVTRALTVRYAVPGFGSQEYSVASVPGVMVGAKVPVCVNPYAAPAVWLIQGDDQVVELAPITRTAAGFRADAPVFGLSFARKPDTVADTARKRMDKTAFGAHTQAEVEAARKRREQPFATYDAVGFLDERTVAQYMQRKGTALPIERPRVEAAPLTIAQAAQRLRAMGLTMNPQRYQRIADAYPHGVREQDLERLACELRAGTPDAGNQKAAGMK